MKKFLLSAIFTFVASVSFAKPLAEVDTAFQLFGPNHKVKIERFDDPEVENASCYVSYAETGGFLSVFAEDPSRFSIACRATGPIKIVGTVTENIEEVFNRASGPLFSEMRVSRFLDTEKNVIVYLVWSTKLIDGSPFNSVTAIAIE